MDKHAILVEGSGDGAILQSTINVLDSDNIDFFVHWDKKFARPHLVAKQSRIFFLKAQKVFWGTYSQIKVTVRLISMALSSPTEYDFFHLISESDFPLMNVHYFNKYFERHRSDLVGFSSQNDANAIKRISYFYPLDGINIRSRTGNRLLRASRLINRSLGIHRRIGFDVYKGSNWFSVGRESAQRIVNFKSMNTFKHSYLADELFVQSIVGKYTTPILSNDDNAQAGRLIDWVKGNPYVFADGDLDYLISKTNGSFLFVRKIHDFRVAETLKEKLDAGVTK
ncbi:beta-1,6-N-acetylglucosaminyltransferase [Lacticaseibacillus pantheris]|uniref:beta-1,6-N-acetylglucosaminyltransferase n=1 Tax=Lacticaseibacillus pantheris TaxID=171523 RepID=UPI0026582E63|nr:beta-1,6-N-acetylglucosaminyltransferase [Lacticaseibacillus pantheris]WKF84158.1 beta-1,6-N-acetylglucosaminyltransferase [Lacticaseibacillus pantheris]